MPALFSEGVCRPEWLIVKGQVKQASQSVGPESRISPPEGGHRGLIPAMREGLDSDRELLVNGLVADAHGALAGTALAGAHDLDALEELLGRAVFLGQQGVGAMEVVAHLLGVTEQNHRNMGGDLLEADDQLFAVHLRHGEVRQDQIDGQFCEEADGLLAITCRYDAVAIGGQHKFKYGQILFIVVYAEDDFFRPHDVTNTP